MKMMEYCISEYFMFLAHLSFHLVICEYFVYSPGFDENATKCQSETSGEKPGINLKIIKSECSVREFLSKIHGNTTNWVKTDLKKY